MASGGRQLSVLNNSRLTPAARLVFSCAGEHFDAPTSLHILEQPDPVAFVVGEDDVIEPVFVDIDEPQPGVVAVRRDKGCICRKIDTCILPDLFLIKNKYAG